MSNKKYAENSALTVLIGNHGKVITELEKRKIRCIILKDNDDIDFSVRNHADMAAYRLSDGKIILDKRQLEAGNKLKKLGTDVIYTDDDISGAYPDDILLNAAKIGDTVIGKMSNISRAIKDDAKNLIDVRQGYAKCSICVVNDNAFITDDKSIYDKCKDNFDVLLIDKGDILLEDKDYGFIGGASGKLWDTVYFFGSLSYHRDGDKIKAFLEKHNAEYVYLFDEKLIDIGGFVEVKTF